MFGRETETTNTAAQQRRAAQVLDLENAVYLARIRERAYTAHLNEQVPAGDTINIHLKNPSSNDVSVVLHEYRPVSEFVGQYNVYDGFSSGPTGGNGNGEDNLLLDTENESPDTGPAEVNDNVTFTADSTHFSEALPGGGASGISTGGAITGTEPIIEPGREIVVELVNESSAESRGSIGIVFYDIDEVYSEQPHPK